jgi:collagen type III alpha
MSSGFANLPQSATDAAIVPPTACESVIEQRLRQTRRQVKGVDVVAGVISLLIGLLGYLLAAAVIDHWLFRGGLGPWGRSLLWFVLVVAVTVYLVRRVLPPMLHRVNPIFAAAAIEQSHPSLKNSLINFLLLRGHRREVALPVYQAIEHRAAADITRARIDIAVDRTHIIRLGYALVAVLTAFSLYQVLSPKNPLRSAARVLLPWSNIDAPTRVTIHDMRPGHTEVFVGENVTISAEVAGLHNGESPLLVYSTADRQTVDATIAMTQPEGEYRYQCRLPAGSAGLQQDCEYRIAAGDCRTDIYRINVRVAPALSIDKITLRPPSYTEMSTRTIEHQGDLQAIEGTEVTIEATANCDMKPDTAEIDLGCTGRRGVKMSANGRAVVGRFVLRLDPNDPTRPEFDSYQLRVADAFGRENSRLVRYRIDVVRDVPPIVQIVEPSDAEVRVPVNGALPTRLRAEDTDF